MSGLGIHGRLARALFDGYGGTDAADYADSPVGAAASCGRDNNYIAPVDIPATVSEELAPVAIPVPEGAYDRTPSFDYNTALSARAKHGYEEIFLGMLRPWDDLSAYAGLCRRHERLVCGKQN